MFKKTFSYTSTVGYGWSTMASNLVFFIGLIFILLFVIYAPAVSRLVILNVGLPEPYSKISSVLLQILGQIIGILLGIGMFKISLSFCDERKPSIKTLFSGAECFWRYLGTAILYALIVLGGMILFIVPGIIWAVKFSLAKYYVVDKGYGPIDALRSSARSTEGVKWELFGFEIFSTMILYAGILCLGIGIFAAVPTVIVAKALVYRQLAAQTILEFESFQQAEMEEI